MLLSSGKLDGRPQERQNKESLIIRQDRNSAINLLLLLQNQSISTRTKTPREYLSMLISKGSETTAFSQSPTESKFIFPFPSLRMDLGGKGELKLLSSSSFSWESRVNPLFWCGSEFMEDFRQV
ncbi:hypothetical protein CEXT_478621 [Caerostris extrusa]|uniref:Uncharacterized protein n=1 Tax=Caerostris extrusa TaxID=172846 RepID=A0AAV4XYZ4_CAEEX|nr:hypothetical protein CEXT_478621 [Caerostris extrusa]